MWTAKKITADAVSKMQFNAGLVLTKFDVRSPKEPADEDIAFETTGDIHVKCTPVNQDVLADVNNAPKDTAEGLRNDGWDCSLDVTALSITAEVFSRALGAAEVGVDGGVTPRRHYQISDFKSLYWVGDMADANKLVCVAMDRSISTSGVDFTASEGKGKLALSFKPYVSTSDLQKVPMAFYVLEKVGGPA